MSLARFSTTDTLRDGRSVTIRAQRPDDLPALRVALSRASDESYHRRFFGPRREFSDREAERFLNIDFVGHVALVAVVEEAGKEAIVAGARYVAIGDGRAEIAFSIIDAYQGLGLGSRLLKLLTGIARESGLREFVAEVLAENLPMLRVFQRAGLPMQVKRDGAVLHVALDLAPPAAV